MTHSDVMVGLRLLLLMCVCVMIIIIFMILMLLIIAMQIINNNDNASNYNNNTMIMIITMAVYRIKSSQRLAVYEENTYYKRAIKRCFFCEWVCMSLV